MIDHILLVAAREFRQIAATRSFWVTLLILPLAFAVGPLTSRFIDRSETETVMLIDQSGNGASAAIAHRIELDMQRRELTALSRFVERHHLEPAAPGAIWVQHGRWYDDADIARFKTSGGTAAALKQIAKSGRTDVPVFERPEADFRIVPTPPALVSTAPANLDRALAPYLRPADKSNRKPVDYILLIPHGFGSQGNAVHLWAGGQPGSAFMATLQTVLAQDLRTSYLRTNGVSTDAAAVATNIAPDIAVTTPRVGGRERVLIRSILPLAASYVLLMSLVLSGSWMLQGTVEERSNKLLETVLACVSPNELMYGKLVGTVGIGLSMVATWALCGIFAAFATHGAVADMIRPALEPVSSFASIATIIYFFVAGYLMVSMIFLVIGAMSESMREAQAYLTPVILVIMLPFTILVQAILRGASGTGIEVMTWIPLYTPFAVLARLGSGMPAWQVLACGTLLAAFILVETVLLGRVFRASLLNAGQRPGVAQIVKLMRSGSAY